MGIKKFQFQFFSGQAGEVFVLHNLKPKLKMLVVQNDNYNYNKIDDYYELLYLNGNKIALVVKSSTIDLNSIEDPLEIKRIIKRALKWYQSQVYIT